MSQTAITFAFEQWKAQEAAAGNTVVLDEFVLAYVPGLDHTAPINRTETLPPEAQIVHRQAVNKIGLVNDNAVVYSVTMGTEIGDFDFNWIGLVNKASGTVAMIVHAPTQRKVANVTGQQGNVLTRSFLMEYNGAATATGITTPAETWQIDFTARLTGIDEMQRLINVDNYGPGAFFGAAYLVAKNGAQFFVTKGTGYISGIRADLPANLNIAVPAAATKVWADVSLQGNITSQWEAVIKITVAPTLANYSQSGFMHYVFAVASIDAAGNITDLRPKGSLTEQETSDALAQHEKSRNHPDGTLLYKGFVQLDSATDSSNETLAATPKAVKIAMDNANARLAKERNGADIPNPALFRQNLALKGAALVDIGNTAGTAAAGDDTRIVNAVQSTNTAISLPGSLTTAGGLKGSTITAVGNVASGNGNSWLAADGNIYGSVWGGYLSTYIGNMRNTALKDWNGWFRDASTGLITQWCTGGGVTHETQNIITYFPMAFPNACLMAHVSTKSPDQNFDNDVFYQTAAWNNTYVVTMLQRPAGARAGTNVYPLFIAIGY
ncbi:TPA: phage tail protein [Yersinia enterocolitica]|nr:phage tail protein [Yersinia enterocolitica]HDL7434317.1 phage tail protein [Yersinia enterocolitica]HDL7476726.1 phage tail protein [Yersinia enterocolitica]